MTQGIDGARALIESRLREIKEEAGSLESALASLGGKVAKQPARKRRKGARRAPRGQRRQHFLAAVRSKPGSTAAELGKEIGISTNQAYALGQRLLKAGQVKKSGKGFRVAK